MRIYKRLRYYFLQTKGYLIFKKKVGILGDFTVVNPKNVLIGNNCGVNHGVFILGHSRIEIGNNVVLSARVMLLDAGLEIDGFANIEFPKHIGSFIRIEDGVWIGAGAIILPGVTIGKKSVVGAGSIVTKDVPPFTVVAGNPARPIGRTDD